MGSSLRLTEEFLFASISIYPAAYIYIYPRLYLYLSRLASIGKVLRKAGLVLLSGRNRGSNPGLNILDLNLSTKRVQYAGGGVGCWALAIHFSPFVRRAASLCAAGGENKSWLSKMVLARRRRHKLPEADANACQRLHSFANMGNQSASH